MARGDNIVTAGRPSTYTDELAEQICDHVANCLPLHKIAAMDGMPKERTIYQWLHAHEEFAHNYTRARESQADKHVSEIFDIADSAAEKMVSVEHAKLRVQVRQWAAERMAPKKYSARLRAELSGEGGGAIQVVLNGVGAKF